jgi:hypothetical protein
MLDDLKELIGELDAETFFAPDSGEQFVANLVVLLLLVVTLVIVYKVIVRLVRG